MPRGRGKQNVQQAKSDSVQRIETVLKETLSGLHFNELKRKTGLHQDTLSIRLKELIEEGIVRKDGKKYRLSQLGDWDLEKRELIDSIESSRNFIVTGGPRLRGSSAYIDEDVILKSTSALAFPGISPSEITSLMKVVHKYWVLRLLTNRRNDTDTQALLEKELIDIDQIWTTRKDSKQILAFTIDLKELKKNLKDERIREIYIKEILRVARIENKHHIEMKRTHGKLREDLRV